MALSNIFRSKQRCLSYIIASKVRQIQVVGLGRHEAYDYMNILRKSNVAGYGNSLSDGSFASRCVDKRKAFVVRYEHIDT